MAVPTEAVASREPRGVAEVFGERLPLAREYAALLADSGVTRGLIGPREAGRLWERHLLNCAVVEVLLPHRTRLLDVGSGAGLPGLVLAIARPDLEVHLVEPMLRRTTWLQEVVDSLGLGNVSVHRGRAQDFPYRLLAPVVTARAVTRLAALAAWCAPLIEPGGRLIALKGQSAERELAEDLAQLRRLGVVDAQVRELGGGVLDPPTRVIDLTFGARTGSVPVAGKSRNSRRQAQS